MSKKSKIVFLVSIILFIVVKLVLVQYYPSPIVFADEGVYSEMAYNFTNNFDLVSRSDYAQNYPPIYSIILSIAHLFNSMRTTFLVMQIINVFLNASVVVLAFLLLKNFVEERHAIVYSFLIGLLPSVFPYSFNLMSENLFIPLLLLSVYLLFIAEKQEKPINHFAFGLSTALMYLTRSIGIVHIIALVLTYIIIFILNKRLINALKSFASSIAGIITILLPYRTIIAIQGKEMASTGYNNEKYIDSILSWFRNIDGFKAFVRMSLSEIGFTAAACLVIFLIFAIIFMVRSLSAKKYRMVIIYSALSYIGSLIITVAHMNGPFTSGNMEYLVFARYLDPFIPLFVAFGFIGYEYYIKEREKTKSLFLILFTSIYPIVLLFLPIDNYKFPNMYSIFYLNLYSSLFVGTMVLLIFLPLMFAALYIKKFKYVIAILLVTVLLMNFPVLYTQSKHSRYYADTLNKVGFFLNNYNDTNVTIDRKGHDSLSYYLFKFWNPSLNFRLIHLEDMEIKEYPGDILISANYYPYKVLFTDLKYTVYDMSELVKGSQ